MIDIQFLPDVFFYIIATELEAKISIADGWGTAPGVP